MGILIKHMSQFEVDPSRAAGSNAQNPYDFGGVS